MAIYAVGDIQGCLQPLLKLLSMVDFNPGKDQLWSTGDIVNRGPESLQTLQFLHRLGSSFKMVLGNHDLHLLAIAAGYATCKKKDTLQEILKSPDRDRLLGWLACQPLLIHQSGYTMTHAGIPPQWSIQQAMKRAKEVEDVLNNSQQARLYFKNMYGNKPSHWREKCEGPDRWRCITNHLTRMRYIDSDGSLDLTCKVAPASAPENLTPWFAASNRKAGDAKIIFGHWASLAGVNPGQNIFALDTGCVWGGCMRLMELGSNRYIETSCAEVLSS